MGKKIELKKSHYKKYLPIFDENKSYAYTLFCVFINLK